MGKRRVVSSVGTIRRLQALGAAGWTFRDIAPRAGLSSKSLTDIMTRPTAYVANARAIEKVYDELSMKQGPSKTALGRAKRKGWAPPLAWDEDTIDDPDARPDFGDREAAKEVDMVVVFRLVKNQPTRSTKAERMAAVLWMQQHGETYEDMAAKIRTSEKSIHRYIAELRQTGLLT